MNMMEIRPAKFEDLEQIQKVYSHARQFMIQNGNPTQWKDGYPQQELLEEDIRKNQLYAVLRDGVICGAFVFFIGDDPTYGYIEGSWRKETPYGVIHRIAGIGGGVFRTALDFAKTKADHLRIDTHADNKPMQHLVEKAGFSNRGTIYVADGSARIAYDLI